MKIIPAAETTCSRGQEHCILLYSEEKAGFLPNIGYIGEQLDLYLASMNIGALWFGIGKTQVRWDGLQFVIMIAIAKMPEDKFRRDMFKSKRKPLEEIWLGDHLGMANIVRFPPQRLQHPALDRGKQGRTAGGVPLQETRQARHHAGRPGNLLQQDRYWYLPAVSGSLHGP